MAARIAIVSACTIFVSAGLGFSVEPVTFERDVKPLLRTHCGKCHSGDKPQSKLNMLSVQSIVTGGVTGPAVVPQKPDQSHLVHLIKRRRMPPPGNPPLAAEHITLIERWIQGGLLAEEVFELPAPADIVSDEDRSHWAFQKLTRKPCPHVVASNKARTPIDLFILAKLERYGLTLAEPAERDTLVRRVFLDLVGRPPMPEQLKPLLEDSSSNAYERLVDELLASPEFGLRWGRHWLDVAGYADTVGFDHNPAQVILSENKWRYRDYVVDALNADVPYDKFLEQQVAGDELVNWKAADRYTSPVLQSLIATGFLRTARDQSHEDVGVIPPNFYEVLHDTMQIVNQGLLGLTIQCARCHDHKFDAIPQRDYYRVMSVFLPAYNPDSWLTVIPTKARVTDRTLADVSPRRQREIERHNAAVETNIGKRKHRLEKLENSGRARIHEQRLKKIPVEIRSAVQEAFENPQDKRNETQKRLVSKFAAVRKISGVDIERALQDSERNEQRQLLSEIESLHTQKQNWGKIQALFDVGPAPTAFVLKRGEFEYPGIPVEPGFLSILCDDAEQAIMRPSQVPNGSSGRRLSFARWLTARDTRASALIARVQVNRTWQALFGRGLVVADFGQQADAPEHLNLLNWLACRFQQSGWSNKDVIRLIVTSSVYRQSSRPAADVFQSSQSADPQNRLLWRMPLRRLESEAIRDSLLWVSDRVNSQMNGPPLPLKAFPDGRISLDIDKLAAPSDRWRRSIYLVTRRGYAQTILSVFDQPAIQTTCTARQVSAIPLQSLTMLNDSAIFDFSEAVADRVLAVGARETECLITNLFYRVLSRPPDTLELALCRQAYEKHQSFSEKRNSTQAEAGRFALTQLAHTLLNANEFLYRE